MKGHGPTRGPMRGAADPAPSSLHFEFEAGSGRHRLWGTVFLSHESLAVNLVGGDLPHVGAVAVSIPRPSPASPRRRSATTSVFTLVGHKEDELARPFAADLAQALGRTTVVVAGVHIHRAGPADLAKVFVNAGRAIETIITRVKAAPANSGLAADAKGSATRNHRVRGGRRRKG
jgi:hypothetical protein